MTGQNGDGPDEASPSRSPSRQDQYPTLKKSISASLANGHGRRDLSPAAPGGPAEGAADRRGSETASVDGSKPTGASGRPPRASPPGRVDLPKLPSGAEIALAALRHLHMPLLVLGNLKTVLLANAAMGRLLGLEEPPAPGADRADTAEAADARETAAVDVLRGQSLTQLGVDMIQNGQPIWVSWERFLDVLGEEMDMDSALSAASSEHRDRPPSPDPDATPHGASPKPPRSKRASQPKPQRPVRDAVVDVVLTSHWIGKTRSGRICHDGTTGQVHAKMVISVWELENQRYFTLSFSRATPTAISTPRSQTRSASWASKSTSASPSSQTSHSPGLSREHCNSCGAAAKKAQTSPSDLPLSLTSPPTSFHTSTPSFLQKTIRIKDAILNAMEIPVFAMWKDTSLALPNKAARKLFERAYDPTNVEQYDVMSRFTAYTEDFSRELEEEEYPIVRLCRTQEPFKSMRIGIEDAEQKKRIFEVSGKGIYDERTGEFLGGITGKPGDLTFILERLGVDVLN